MAFGCRVRKCWQNGMTLLGCMGYGAGLTAQKIAEGSASPRVQSRLDRRMRCGWVYDNRFEVSCSVPGPDPRDIWGQNLTLKPKNSHTSSDPEAMSVKPSCATLNPKP